MYTRIAHRRVPAQNTVHNSMRNRADQKQTHINMEFSLSSNFNNFEVDKSYSVDFPDVDSKLESVTEVLAANPDNINFNSELLDELMELVHGYKTLNEKHQKQVVYLIASSSNTISHQIAGAVQNGDFVDAADNFKASLEKYGYLIYVLLVYLGKEDHSRAFASKLKHGNSEAHRLWKANCALVEELLECIHNVLKIDLTRIFITTPERDRFIELFTRPIFRLMEVAERMKITPLKLLMFRDLAVAVKFHGQSLNVQSAIIQCLTYYIHLPQYMAEFLHVLDELYDHNGLTEEVLREISQIEFNSNDNNGPKSISEFLIKLSESSPRLILKQMSCIAQLLDNSNYTLRCSVVETCGNIVVDVAKKGRQNDDESGRNTDVHIDGLVDLLQERFLDQNPYVRTKAIQAFVKIFNMPSQFNERRQKIMELLVRSLDDRSTLVRRNAIKLMSKLVLTHPFAALHGTQLSYKFWLSRYESAKAYLKDLLEREGHLAPINEDVNSEHDEDDGDVSMEEDNPDDEEDQESEDGSDADGEANSPRVDSENDHSCSNPILQDSNTLIKARLTLKYYEDAIAFIEAIHAGVDIISRLLYSKNRNEVLESMDFLVLADAYDIQNASEGIRKMLHLVWMKGSSDEGKSISAHLIDCYQQLFLSPREDSSRAEQAAYIAKNLVSLTHAASIADLASLEKLLCLMYENKLVHPDVLQVLWQIYNFKGESTEFSQKQRRGAVIVLGMFALGNSQIAADGLDSLLTIGLGELGKKDMSLARYTCIALQRLVEPNDKEPRTVRIKREDEIVEKLSSVLLEFNEDGEWFSVAEQAIGALFTISDKPDEICSTILKEKTAHVFGDDSSNQINSLSQLLFMVGHVSIKTIVYLENLEGQFKKRKQAVESGATKEAAEKDGGEDNELEMIGGTSEDDFADAVLYIKEKELLYGENSLLAKFGNLVREICSKSKNYQHQGLQRSATLCLVKLMCISSRYCEQNLPLLITIMEKSPDPIIRCNCVLGLGDMAVCFNNLVDENTDFLYRRLNDKSIMVQRTCLMTVTFLILAGQVKVKGQLSSMAKCLENPDQGISDMCRLFFSELATKDNAIYNGFIDIFSGLLNDETLSKDSMKRVVKFLVGFIEKERQQKQLAEKLLVRLTKCLDEQQWNDVAFVLATIPYKSEAITQALDGGYKIVLARQ